MFDFRAVVGVVKGETKPVLVEEKAEAPTKRKTMARKAHRKSCTPIIDIDAIVICSVLFCSVPFFFLGIRLGLDCFFFKFRALLMAGKYGEYVCRGTDRSFLFSISYFLYSIVFAISYLDADSSIFEQRLKLLW